MAGGSLSYTAVLAARSFSFDGRRSTGVGGCSLSIGSLLITSGSVSISVGCGGIGEVGSLSFSYTFQ